VGRFNAKTFLYQLVAYPNCPKINLTKYQVRNLQKSKAKQIIAQKFCKLLNIQ